MKSISSKTSLMGVRMVRKQGITHPFGDHRSVNQAFPAAIPSKASDPFLMCDYFAMMEGNGPVQDPDDFPVGWHPHRGFDIASYLKSGTGRHGDSLGNRETFETPGMQWMSTGSGVEHAEGGATEKGIFMRGFQIWINVPSQHKMDDPKYGTVPSQDLPLVKLTADEGENATARVLAGNLLGAKGPFATVQPVEMVDFELSPNAIVEFDIGSNMDTAMLYVYQGSLKDLNGKGKVGEGFICLLDADLDMDTKRAIRLEAAPDEEIEENGDGEPKKVGVMLFAGKKLNEEIAWHGPIVMNTQQEVRETLMELRMGQFPPNRVPWDYKRLSEFPHAAAEEKSEL
ncbi:unnamed protein product [Cylindrotheca closterium]|uniref:Pirin n=1 Tax=Cylindrotheca closterium TaxID=2856 RepID=A0AAD2FRQ1_9STRA|nr:unnamed protein product [Cylindrotheca closterium]